MLSWHPSSDVHFDRILFRKILLRLWNLRNPLQFIPVDSNPTQKESPLLFCTIGCGSSFSNVNLILYLHLTQSSFHIKDIANRLPKSSIIYCFALAWDYTLWRGIVLLSLREDWIYVRTESTWGLEQDLIICVKDLLRPIITWWEINENEKKEILWVMRGTWGRPEVPGQGWSWS